MIVKQTCRYVRCLSRYINILLEIRPSAFRTFLRKCSIERNGSTFVMLPYSSNQVQMFYPLVRIAYILLLRQMLRSCDGFLRNLHFEWFVYNMIQLLATKYANLCYRNQQEHKKETVGRLETKRWTIFRNKELNITNCEIVSTDTLRDKVGIMEINDLK